MVYPVITKSVYFLLAEHRVLTIEDEPKVIKVKIPCSFIFNDQNYQNFGLFELGIFHLKDHFERSGKTLPLFFSSRKDMIKAGLISFKM